MNNNQFNQPNNENNNNTSFNGQSLNNQNNNMIYPNNNSLYANSNQIDTNNYQTTNTMSQESINSQNNYTPQNSKKNNKNKILIIISIVLIAVIAIIVGILLIGKDENRNSGNKFNNNSNNASSSDEIVQIYVDGYKGNEYNTVVALSKNNKLYAIGKNSNGWGGQGDLKKVTLLADNVNNFDNKGDFYIDNTGNINISGISIKGGVYDQYQNIGGDMKKISGQWSGILAVDKDGNLYSYGMAEYNGFGVRYDELTKIENIKEVTDVYLDIYLAYYINSSHELYAKCTSCSGEFEKILDNVKVANGNAIQTQDNKIYDISYDSDESKVVALPQEEAVSIINTSSGTYYQSEDNNMWDIDGYQRKLSLVNSYSHHYPKDVKQMIYMKEVCNLSSCSGIKYIYLNNSNKLNLYEVKYNNGNYSNVSDENNETINYTIDNIEKIYNFISS